VKEEKEGREEGRSGPERARNPSERRSILLGSDEKEKERARKEAAKRVEERLTSSFCSIMK